MTAHDEAGGPLTREEPKGAPEPASMPSKRAESVRTLWRVCLSCRRAFEVNPRHADAHRFCSAACRSRHRHRARRTGPVSALAASVPVEVVAAPVVELEPPVAGVATLLVPVTEPPMVPVTVTPCRYCVDLGGCEFCGGPVPGRRCAYCAEGVRLAVVAAAVVA